MSNIDEKVKQIEKLLQEIKTEINIEKDKKLSEEKIKDNVINFLSSLTNELRSNSCYLSEWYTAADYYRGGNSKDRLTFYSKNFGTVTINGENFFRS